MTISKTVISYKGYNPYALPKWFPFSRSQDKVFSSRFNKSFKDRALSSIFKTVKEWLEYFSRSAVYFATTKEFNDNLDDDILISSREKLRAVGGERHFLETYDGARIDTMFFSAKSFRKIVEEKGGRFDLIDEGEERREVLDIFSSELYDLLSEMNIFIHTLPSAHGRILMNCKFSKEKGDDSLSRLEKNQPVVTILTLGNGCLYEFMRRRILYTLLFGQDCMVFNIRGTGRSKGVPTKNRTYIDIETVYQYLIHEKKYLKSNISVWGYCLGGFLATNLADSHSGVNLLLDRCMPDMSPFLTRYVMERTFVINDQRVSLIRKVGDCFLRNFVLRPYFKFIVGYSIASKLKILGNLCMVNASSDATILADEREQLRREVFDSKNDATQIIYDGEHIGDWDSQTLEAYFYYLTATELGRSYGISPTTAIPANDG
jgi:hypothetical protein